MFTSICIITATKSGAKRRKKMFVKKKYKESIYRVKRKKTKIFTCYGQIYKYTTNQQPSCAPSRRAARWSAGGCAAPSGCYSEEPAPCWLSGPESGPKPSLRWAPSLSVCLCSPTALCCPLLGGLWTTTSLLPALYALVGPLYFSQSAPLCFELVLRLCNDVVKRSCNSGNILCYSTEVFLSSTEHCPVAVIYSIPQWSILFMSGVFLFRCVQ